MSDWNADLLPAQAIGHWAGLDLEGRPQVTVPGCDEPRFARALVGIDVSRLGPDVELLLALVGDDECPVIVGVLADPSVPQGLLDVQRPEDATLDGQTIRLEAKKEIALVCGKSSILLRRDGKIVVKGVEVVSRATGQNRIKGSSVQIN